MFNRIRSIRKRWLALAGATAFMAAAMVAGTVFSTTTADAGQYGGYNRYGGANPGADHGDARHGKGRGGGDVMARAAEILEIEEDTLRAAFTTARDERADARFEERVQNLVDDEAITEGDATAANDWFDGRPDGSGPLALKLSGTSDSDTVDRVLEHLVDRERLTQDEADAVSDWHDDRPAALPEREKRGRGHGKGHHSHHGKHGGRGH